MGIGITIKDSARKWYSEAHDLGLSWTEFQSKFIEQFDGPGQQSNLIAEMVSKKQDKSQTLVEFIAAKLARLVKTGLTEEQFVEHTVNLMGNEFAIFAKLQKPRTFAEIRRLAKTLDAITESDMKSLYRTILSRLGKNQPKHQTN